MIVTYIGGVIMLFILHGNPEIGAHVNEWSLSFDLFKRFYDLESSDKSDFFLHARARCSELKSNITTRGMHKCTNEGEGFEHFMNEKRLRGAKKPRSRRHNTNCQFSNLL